MIYMKSLKIINFTILNSSKMENQEKVSYHIKSAKTRKVKADKVVDVVYKRVISRPNGKISIAQITEEGSDIVHPDLILSLKAFVPHFLMLGERANVNDFQPSYFKEKKYLKENSPYEVTGIHVKEQNEKQYVILVGRQNLKSGRVISMTIPMVCFDPHEEDEDVYAFHKELKNAVDEYLSEAEQYLSGKIGMPDQTELELKPQKEAQDEPESNLGEDVPETKLDALDQVIEEKKKPVKMKKVS